MARFSETLIAIIYSYIFVDNSFRRWIEDVPLYNILASQKELEKIAN